MNPVQTEGKQGKDMKNKPEGKFHEKRRRIPLAALILMIIGLLTVIYFLITYALMPLLAMITVT